MRRAILIEAARRVTTLVVTTFGFVFGFRYGAITAGMLLAMALAAYVLIPREVQPAGALLAERLPAIVGPDVLGFLLGTVFLGMPFAAAVFEGQALGTIHPSAVLAWPMAVFALIILGVATRYATYWVVIEADGLRIADIWEEKNVPYTSIERVEPYRRGLPGIIRLLTPLLIFSGRYTQAGAIVLARDTMGIRIVAKENAWSVVIVEEGFQGPFKRIVAALKKHGVLFVPE